MRPERTMRSCEGQRLSTMHHVGRAKCLHWLQDTSRDRKVEMNSHRHVRRASATATTSFGGTGPPAGTGSSLLSAKPDAKAFIADVKNPLGDLFIDSLCSLNERVINIVGSLRTSLQEYQAVFLRKCLTLIGRYLPLVLEIAFVTDESCCCVRVLPRVFEPSVQVIECLSPSHIIDEQRTSST